ncbi:hypothetical protein H6F67_10995 [Microcoleus sp. FACHB-1515]|uniref:hypothetical protein n=1 Tax=Cyanophyceae TaxID=3028117 RepID=UPI0016890E93|nr:hypothetical protein [Microcoleus sp. FACHB-1515]MBD2090381.1 hypothetical protein [Microcoleus sp. FACHB-1515]
MKQLQGYTIGSVAPANPRTGDRWLEISVTGAVLYGWDWVWSGSRWISPEQWWRVSFSDIAALTVHSFDASNLRLLLLDFRTNAYTTATQTSANYWFFRFWETTAQQTRSLLCEVDAIGNAPNQFVSEIVSLASLTTQPVLELSANFVGTSNPGILRGAASVRYQFVRP